MLKNKKQQGITLMSLVITVIILLIIAGVAIGTFMPDGLIEKAEQAKKKAEIDNERQIVETSVLQAVEENRYGNIEQSELDAYVKKNANKRPTEVMVEENELVVGFLDTSRYYKVDDEGSVSWPIEKVVDEYAGDITKGGKYDGKTESTAYQISCIEDLVAFSIAVNGGNTDLGLKENSFKNEYIKLTKTLDFNSIFSYNDHMSTKYGDLNTDGTIENIKTELTKTAEGCIGFTPIGIEKTFNGAFDGQGNEIKSIYINSNGGEVGLFGRASNEIKNVTVTGTIINNAWDAAGICGLDSNGTLNVINCKNYANVTGYNMVGGIIALGKNTISNCENYGDIKITGKTYQYGGVGGIAGHSANGVIDNCINEGKVEDVNNKVGSNMGGIIGCCQNATITNCANKVENKTGIVGWVQGGSNSIINCYNLKECNCGIVEKFGGADWSAILELNIKNCYNVGDATNSGIIGDQYIVASQITLNIENCYNAGNTPKAIIGKITTNSGTTTITNVKNTYYESSKAQSAGATETGITASNIKDNAEFIVTLNNNIGTNNDWKRWKLGVDGYPCFE